MFGLDKAWGLPWVAEKWLAYDEGLSPMELLNMNQFSVTFKCPWICQDPRTITASCILHMGAVLVW